MTTKTKFTSVLLAASLSLITSSSLVFAGPGAKAKGEHQITATGERARFDLNKDGVIDLSERRAKRQSRRAENLAKYDADRDGKLSQTERGVMKQQRLADRFRRLDVNRDNLISNNELPGDDGRMEKRFAKFDADGNGAVTWTEFEAGAGKANAYRHGMRKGKQMHQEGEQKRLDKGERKGKQKGIDKGEHKTRPAPAKGKSSNASSIPTKNKKA